MREPEEEYATVKGLRRIAQLCRDPWGMPHAKAAGAWDALLCLGYAHAQDRLWQTEKQRRRAIGRWAEWRGLTVIDTGRLARRLGAARAVQRDYDALGREVRETLDAYAAVVNAFVAIESYTPECGFLGAAPEAWRSWRSIAVMRRIGFLMGSVWGALFRGAALPVVGAELVGNLQYDDGSLDLLCLPQGAERAQRTRFFERRRIRGTPA